MERAVTLLGLGGRLWLAGFLQLGLFRRSLNKECVQRRSPRLATWL